MVFVVDRQTLVLGLGGILAAWAITRALDQLVLERSELNTPTRSSRRRLE